MPTNKLTLTLTGNASKNTAALDPVEMPEADAIEHLDYTFDNMHNYSDLNYLIIRVSAGATYTFENGIKWMLEGTYHDLDDRTGYVFGDESGSILVVRSGVQIDF